MITLFLTFEVLYKYMVDELEDSPGFIAKHENVSIGWYVFG
jgi:hypothetical protein